MENKFDIEVFGTLTKLETVLTIDDRIIPGTLVFETLAPFPGYYNDAPEATKPVYMYMALQQQYTLVDLLRATENIEKVFEHTFEAGKGFLQIYDQSFSVIRIRHLKQYDEIGKLQEAYQEQGIEPLKKTKKGLEEPAHIRLVKFFYFNKLADGVYLDNKEEFHAYIDVPHGSSWEEFNELTMRVKYNWEGSKFDAAMGSYYKNGKLQDFVRIYSKKVSLPYLQELRKLYIAKLK